MPDSRFQHLKNRSHIARTAETISPSYRHSSVCRAFDSHTQPFLSGLLQIQIPNSSAFAQTIQMSSATAVPDLPIVAALESDDSMLTRRFGKEVVNYYAGSRVNRFSFLRADTGFLHQAAVSPTARYLALSELNLLVVDKRTPAYFTFNDVQPLIGSEPFAQTEDEAIQNFDSTKTTPLIVFLGMLEEGHENDRISSTDHGDIRGHPYFAVDISPKGNHAEKAASFLAEQEKKGISLDKNPRAMSHSPEAGKFKLLMNLTVETNVPSRPIRPG
jgi:NAD+ diphosphatase